MRRTEGWQANAVGDRLERVPLHRRELRADDLAVRVDFCGVCHTDLHALRAHSGSGPLVPGHEFTGVVTETGAQVTRFAPGQRVAVGNIVDSCGACPMCLRGQQNFCRELPVLTYGGQDRADGSTTLGGFSGEYVVREAFAYPLPAGLDPAAAAPLMCAGITVWEPLEALGVGPGTTVGVAGLGGLGHLAVRLAAARGAHTTVLSRTADKAADAQRLGASDFLLTTDATAMAAARDRFDVVLDTIAVPHEPGPLLSLVAMDGTLSLLGELGPVTVSTMDLLVGRKKLSSAGSGGVPNTAAMLRFCAEHGVCADVEVLASAEVNTALARLADGDVRYRFVLDLADLRGTGQA